MLDSSGLILKCPMSFENLLNYAVSVFLCSIKVTDWEYCMLAKFDYRDEIRMIFYTTPLRVDNCIR